MLRQHLNLRKVSFAAMDAAVVATGTEYGGITPIGLPGDWPILIDRAVTVAGPVVLVPVVERRRSWWTEPRSPPSHEHRCSTDWGCREGDVEVVPACEQQPSLHPAQPVA